MADAMRFFAFVISLLCVLCFGRPAEATQKSGDMRVGQALSLLGSMANDPDAVECVRRACLAVPYRDRVLRHQRLEACKSDHFKRVAAVMSRDQRGPQLRSYQLGERVPPPDALLCGSVTGRPEPSAEQELEAEFVRRQEIRLAALTAERDAAVRSASNRAGGQGAPNGGTGAAVPAAAATAAVDHPSTASAGTKSPPPKPTATKYSGLTGPDKANVAHCAPEHFTVRESDKDRVKLYVDADAAYDQLARSCLANHYRTDAVPVVEENYVEATIPVCFMPDGRVELDPTRYAEILSGKRKLAMHGAPNLEFHRQCTAKGGKPWVALQGRQILWLAGKDAPRQAWPESDAVGSSGASPAPVMAEARPETPVSGTDSLPDASSAEGLPATVEVGTMSTSEAPDAEAGSTVDRETVAPDAAPPDCPNGCGDRESLPGGVPPSDDGDASRPDAAWIRGLDGAARRMPTPWRLAQRDRRHGSRLPPATAPPAKTPAGWPELSLGHVSRSDSSRYPTGPPAVT